MAVLNPFVICLSGVGMGCSPECVKKEMLRLRATQTTQRGPKASQVPGQVPRKGSTQRHVYVRRELQGVGELG